MKRKNTPKDKCCPLADQNCLKEGCTLYNELLVNCERYGEILRLHVFTDEALQNIQIDQITRKLIKVFLRRLKKNRAAATVETTYSALNGIFKEAIDDEYIDIKPVQGTARQGKEGRYTWSLG